MKFGIVALGALALMGSSAFADSTIGFGGPGRVTESALAVFVDKAEADPRCANCVRFSILGDGHPDGWAGGSPLIEQVILIASHPGESAYYTEYHESFSERLATRGIQLRSIPEFASVGSSGQQVYDLPTTKLSMIVDTKFTVIALRRKSMRSREYVIAAQGDFTAAQVRRLEPALKFDLIKK